MADITQLRVGTGATYNIKDASAFHGGTFSSQTNANATATQALTTAQVRDAIISSNDLTPGTSSLATGVIYFYYT